MTLARNRYSPIRRQDARTCPVPFQGLDGGRRLGSIFRRAWLEVRHHCHSSDKSVLHARESHGGGRLLIWHSAHSDCALACEDLQSLGWDASFASKPCFLVDVLRWARWCASGSCTCTWGPTTVGPSQSCKLMAGLLHRCRPAPRRWRVQMWVALLPLSPAQPLSASKC